MSKSSIVSFAGIHEGMKFTTSLDKQIVFDVLHDALDCGVSYSTLLIQYGIAGHCLYMMARSGDDKVSDFIIALKYDGRFSMDEESIQFGCGTDIDEAQTALMELD